MERSLLGSALAIGIVGWLYSLILSRSSSLEKPSDVKWDIPRPYLVFAGILPLLVFLLTLPSKPPFAAGQGFGKGFLVGGLGALLAGWTALRLCRIAAGESARSAAAVAAPFSLAVAVAVIPLLWIWQSLLDTLLGVAIGWFAVTMLLTLGSRDEEGNEGRVMLPLACGVGFVITLCALAALGELRGAGRVRQNHGRRVVERVGTGFRGRRAVLVTDWGVAVRLVRADRHAPAADRALHATVRRDACR